MQPFILANHLIDMTSLKSTASKTLAISGIIFHFEPKAFDAINDFLKGFYKKSGLIEQPEIFDTKVIEFLLMRLLDTKPLISFNDIVLLERKFHNYREACNKPQRQRKSDIDNLTKNFKYILQTIVDPTMGIEY